MDAQSSSLEHSDPSTTFPVTGKRFPSQQIPGSSVWTAYGIPFFFHVIIHFNGKILTQYIWHHLLFEPPSRHLRNKGAVTACPLVTGAFEIQNEGPEIQNDQSLCLQCLHLRWPINTFLYSNHYLYLSNCLSSLKLHHFIFWSSILAHCARSVIQLPDESS